MSKKIIQRLNSEADEESIENADQVEWAAFLDGSSPIDYAIRDENLVGDIEVWQEHDDESDLISESSSPYWLSRASTEESLTGRAEEECERRKLILKDKYPFIVENGGLVYRPSKDLLYEFLLAVSMSPNLTKAPFNELPVWFERSGASILTSWLGQGAKGWQTGWPGRMKAGLPADLKELYHQIYDQTGEWEWSPSSDVPEIDHERQRDLGVDMLVWKGFSDHKASSLFLAGQCACGKDALDGVGKSHDLDAKWLAKWFRVQSAVDFVKCLLIPRCLGGNARALRVVSGVLYFDRLRLVDISGDVDPLLIAEYSRLIDVVKNS